MEKCETAWEKIIIITPIFGRFGERVVSPGGPRDLRERFSSIGFRCRSTRVRQLPFPGCSSVGSDRRNMEVGESLMIIWGGT